MFIKFKTKHFNALLILLNSLVWLSIFTFPNPKLHLVFCDVGQGDAALITQGFKQILIDGGPNDKVLTCLKNNMPFFDRKIEIIALTHPEADHMTGLLSVLDKYDFEYFLMGPEGGNSAIFAELLNKLEIRISNIEKNSNDQNPNDKNKNVLNLKNLNLAYFVSYFGFRASNLVYIINPYSGTRIKVGDLVLDTLWPEREWVAEKLGEEAVIAGFPAPRNFSEVGSPRPSAMLRVNQRGERRLKSAKTNDEAGTKDNLSDYQADNLTATTIYNSVLGYSTTSLPLNQFGLVFQLNYRGKKVLFMADADSKIQDEIIESNNIIPIDILKFPHHGSKTGMRADFLNLINPKETVISVGKNSYGHPTKEALDMLRNNNSIIRRTDLEGEIIYNF